MEILEKMRHALDRLIARRVSRPYCQWSSRSDAHGTCGYYQVCDGCEDHIVMRENKPQNACNKAKSEYRLHLGFLDWSARVCLVVKK